MIDFLRRKEALERPPQLELPGTVKWPVIETNRRIMRRVYNAEKPDVALVLERSAVLPASSVSRALTNEGVPVVPVPVGKILPVMFGEKHNIAEEDVDLNDAGQAQEFIDWVRATRDPTVRELRRQLIENLNQNSKILVLDDAQASGETVRQTLPLLIKAVTREFPILTTESFYPGNFNWEGAILDSAEQAFTPAEKGVMSAVLKGGLDLRRVKLELESGWYELDSLKRNKLLKSVNHLYERGVAIAPTSINEIMTLIGLQSMQEARNLGRHHYADATTYEKDTTENPADRLVRRFGNGGLLQMRDQVVRQFQNLPTS